MKILIIVTFLFSQGLMAAEKIDFGSEINNNIQTQKSLEDGYKTSLEKLDINEEEQQLIDYVKHELEYEKPEAMAESDAEETTTK